jgi:hypothetical protein
VTFAPTVTICENDEPFVERWRLKPVSFVVLSVHLRLIWAREIAVAMRLEGAAGGPAGVALAWFELPLSPDELEAVTT